ncbi:MAG TPA: RagB/SusD family nutrient uptake outer membrane protein [Aquella sp.]|nr:RagB/SusD family nutrient uptake outer membrane protein [Aquella sp.]
MTFRNIRNLTWVLPTIILGCNKFVTVPPPVTEIVGATVFNTNSTAASAVSGIYLSMAGSTPPPGSSIGGGQYGISALLGLSSDDFTLYPTTDPLLNQTYSNSLLSNNPAPMWADLYNCIYKANTAIEGLLTSSGVTPSMKQQLTGEAKFIRAFCNFYLINIYGDVPLVTVTNYKINEVIYRSSQSQVYKQIEDDLDSAMNLLSDNFLAPDGTITSERVRPNRVTVEALLARVYLYQQKWDSAETEATSVINNSNYSLVNNLDSAFLANNTEAIWQLEMPNNGFNAPDGFYQQGPLYYGGPNAYAPFILSNSLMSNFETGDLRKLNWTDSIQYGGTTYFFPYKYKLYYTGVPAVEYATLFRLAEQYLIRAEARAQKSDLTGSEADLNIIRNRAGLPPTSASTQQDLLNAIYHERRFELFTEYGHRWLDLKRNNTLDSVMNVATPQKGGVWKSNDQLYPLPLTEIKSDPNLTQNPGY